MTNRNVVESASMPGSRQLPVKEAAEPARPQAGPREHAPAVPMPGSAGSKDAGPKDAGASASRLGWLDVLRGVAALAVVFDHISYYTLQHVRELIYQWFDPGNYGVFVFFLIRGTSCPRRWSARGASGPSG